ncbi:MAG: sugar phosphate isomerase/epimerase [Clostridiales bacterium]|nr:sugar phosphate isomerase/epimerase [Clostridiales bacterium]
MKLAFSTLGCPEWSLDEIAKNGKRMGFQGVEIRGILGNMEADSIPEFFPENREATLQTLKEHGLTITDFASSISFHDPSQQEKMEKEGREAIALCAAMHIPAIRVFGDQVEKADTVAGEVNRIVKGISWLCQEAKGTQVSIWLEVHGQINTAPRVLKIAEKVASDRFGIIWDVEHTDATYGNDFLSFYRPVRHLIRHVHIKDHVRLPDGGKQLCLVGKGDLKLKEMIAQMEQDGYQGYYSLEWEKKWHPELEEPEVAFQSYADWMRSLS